MSRLLSRTRVLLGGPPKGKNRNKSPHQLSKSSPNRRRLFAGVTKTIPIVAKANIEKPRGQKLIKKGLVNTSPERQLPEEQHYSRLAWDNEDDTPTLLHPNSLDLQGYGKEGGDYWDGYHFNGGQFRRQIEERPCQVISMSHKDLSRVRYPAVPSVDSRFLSNSDWRSYDRQERIRNYLQKHRIFSLYPEIHCNLNMNINFGPSDSKRHYWDSVYTGNVIEVKKMLQPPRVIIPDDNLEDPEALYTLVMHTPDYPFRAEPDAGHSVHWVVSNIKIQPNRECCVAGPNAKATVVVPYLQPLPSEDAGLLRYVFSLFKQTKAVDVPESDKLDAAKKGAYLHEGRSNYFLHTSRRKTPTSAFEKAMSHVENCISADPSALSFSHVGFDYEVMDWYNANEIPEPMYTPSDIVDNLTNFKISEVSFHRFTPFGGEVVPKIWKFGRSQNNFF
eukprot:TRINITY_DN9375_c4_g1_i1.p1 TRINITY_DN9375_c4_g1~~TRINITY_DN9375_c4_g1_i1.p1  ORF type:complete len:446 (+),score=54.26 TRINITY_DN9375_c4_g1_i1:68-1405(+)